MSALFSAVARGNSVLAKHACCVGNFTEILEQILPKIPVNEDDNKYTYAYEKYFFHVLVTGKVTYLCIADMDADRVAVFSFLTDVQQRFESTYGKRALTALPYAMNSDFSFVLANQMKAYFNAQAPKSDRLKEMQNEVEGIKSIMVRNIDGLISRGERLEVLVDRSENLESASVSFRESGRKVSTLMYWRNMRMTVIIVASLLLLLFIIVTWSCGGLSYSKC